MEENSTRTNLTKARRQQCLSLIRDFNEATHNLSPESLDENNPGTRDLAHKLANLSSRLYTTLLDPAEVAFSQAFMINTTMAIRILIERDIFKILATPPSPQHAPLTTPWTYASSELSSRSGVEEELLIRLLRCAEALNYVDVPRARTYAPNAVTVELADPALAAGVALVYDNAARPNSNLSAFMDYFRAEGYAAPHNASDGPWQRANGTVGRTTFDVWLADGEPAGSWPGERERFNRFMHRSRGGRPHWFEGWDLRGRVLADYAARPGEIFMVDLGGGHGQDLRALHKTFPGVGRLVLTDLPVVLDEIDRASLPADIDIAPQDLFQPFAEHLRNAKVYFAHMIFHDWPDEDCKTFLRNIRDVMVPGYSRILINDAVLPDMGAGIVQAGFDITMMAHHCGIERDRQMWYNLVDGVEGLEIVNIWDNPGGEGIVEVVRRSVE